MEDFIPLVAIVATFSVPVIAILVHHQRKMAELIHRNHYRAEQPSPELLAIRQELSELRHLLTQQAIAMDDLRTKAIPAKSESELSGRIGA
jgi:hypothetical protein